MRRVLVAGDWHGNAAWAATCCRLASRHGCEAMLQLGDFGIWEPRRTEDFLDRIEEAAGEAGITGGLVHLRVVGCSGTRRPGGSRNRSLAMVAAA